MEPPGCEYQMQMWCHKEVGNKNSHGINNNCRVHTSDGNTLKHVCNQDNKSWVKITFHLNSSSFVPKILCTVYIYNVNIAELHVFAKITMDLCKNGIMIPTHMHKQQVAGSRAEYGNDER